MLERIINVFYGNDCLPYKDKERLVHFPIIGNAFQNASNTTEIRFYADRIGGNSRQWVCIGKLPNGKRGFRVLPPAVYDAENNEYYLSFSLTSFFTQYKGDLFLCLGGYNGNFVELNQDEEYELTGNNVVETTGAIKLNIAYATQINGSDEDIDNWQDFLSALGTKLNIADGIVVIANASVDVSNYEEGQVFYSKADQTIYKLVSGVLIPQGIGIIKTNTIANGTILDKNKVALDMCYVIFNTTGVIYRKVESDTGSGLAHFVNELEFINGSSSANDFMGRSEFYVVLSTGAITSSTLFTKEFYNKSQIDNQFYNKSQAALKFASLDGNNTFSGNNVFEVLPQTKEGRNYTSGRELADKQLVETSILEKTGNVPSGKTLQGQIDDLDVSNFIPSSEKGSANGVATLDSSGKVPLSQMSNSILGQNEYCGSWDASLDESQLTSDHPLRKGDYYICQTSGTYNPQGTQDSPVNEYEVGDWAVYDGIKWEKIDNTDAVVSVNNKNGAVTLYGSDIEMTDSDNTTLDQAIDSKLPTETAINDYQAKILHNDLSSIPTNAWTLDTSETPNVYKYVSGNLYEGLGYVNTNDLAEIIGINASDRNAIAKYGIYLDNVLTTNDYEEIATFYNASAYDDTNNYSVGDYCVHNNGVYVCINATTGTFNNQDWEKINHLTYAIILSTLEVEESVSLSVIVTKQYADGGQADALITQEDLDDNTMQIVDSKIGVKLSTLVDMFYPIGSVFTTTDNTETTTTLHNRLGGTWEALNSGNAINVPLNTNAPVYTSSSDNSNLTSYPLRIRKLDGTAPTGSTYLAHYGDNVVTTGDGYSTSGDQVLFSNLYADLSSSLTVYMFKRVA